MNNNEEYLERLKSDIRHQLSFEEIDWDYLLKTMNEARELAIKLDLNFTE